MNSKTPECWSVDPQARGLRVELSPTHSLVLPFEHFIYSELERGDDEDSLKLAFATHEVVLKGGQLRRVEAAVQRLELALVAVVPEIYKPIAGGPQPFIKEILVMSPTSPGKAEQDAQGSKRELS